MCFEWEADNSEKLLKKLKNKNDPLKVSGTAEQRSLMKWSISHEHWYFFKGARKEWKKKRIREKLGDTKSRSTNYTTWEF